jgi:predicted dehydrogenase
MKMKKQSRRSFIKTSLGSSASLIFLPSIIPSRLLGADAPSKKINVAVIGCGREGRSDMGNTMTEPLARVVAVCDLDSHRLTEGKAMVMDYYTERGESGVNVKTFHDYHDVLASPDIDAVIISVPDHSHALVATEAAIAGKHIYLQKPATYTIAEGIGVRRVIKAKKIISQIGSQERSSRPWGSFRKASEAVRNGRVGQLKKIEIGLFIDKPSGLKPAPMPVPPNLDYERWLGPAPEQPYMEGRVHPQNELRGRPGWATTEDFGLGMITNWGTHFVDIALWAMGQELGGPLSVEAQAEFMKNDMWNVHTTYHVEMMFPNNVLVILDDKFPAGLRFEGDEGWVFCKRGDDNNDNTPPLTASDKKIISPLDANAVRWMPSKSHFGNWLEGIVANRQPIEPIDQAVRTLETCVAAWISMKLKRKLTWDATKEVFIGDDAANAMLSRKSRKPEYDYQVAMKKAGIA